MVEVIGDQEETVAGLIPLEKLAEKLKEQGEENFLRSYSHPFLARKISKIHATFIPKARDNFDFVDMGSSNGTIVNGTQLIEKEPILVEHGDRIAMWRYIFEFAEPRPLVRILREMFGK